MAGPTFRAAGATDPGLQRDNNEDRFHVDPARGLFMVIDGVGGQAAGGEAAALALSMLRTRLERETGPIDERVREAIAVANNEILKAASTRPDWNGMACVLTVAVLKDGVATIGHVGDTRLYKIRHGGITKVTRDHSPVGEREDAGELSESEAMRHPRRNEVYRDVGSEPHQPGDADFVDIVTVPVEDDAALVLCSDGLSDLVPSSTIGAIAMRGAGEPARVVKGLVDAAIEAGGKDNVTAIYVEGARFAAAVPEPARAPRRRSRVTVAAVVALILSLVAWALVRAGVVRLTPNRETLVDLPTSGVQVVGPQDSIGAALDRATAGGQIIVEPGEYREQIRLKDGVRLVSRVPRAAVIRMPVDTSEAAAAVVAADLSSGDFSGFRIVGDAATPLGTGLLVQRSTLSISDVEIVGAMAAAVEFGSGAEASFVGGDVHDNVGPGVVIRSGASPRISHSGFLRNGMSEHVATPVVIEPGAQGRLDQNVFGGVGPEAFQAFPPDARQAVARDNWFPGARPPAAHPPAARPPAAAPGRGSVRPRSSR
jgi:serine/threonine protein phosphatase PrpC